MDEPCYLISDASKKVDVETHVLRYWEEELGLAIPRNEMGHRYYTEFHIRLFCQVKKLKDRGYQLKAIKNAMKQIMTQNQGIAETAHVLENDIARTLQENQRFRFTCRFSSDEPLKKVKEEENEQENQENDFSNLSHLADYNRLEERSLIKITKKEEKVKAPAAAVNSEKNNQIIQEKEEKDGRTDMKNKGKNRKKPSAWERRNGIVAGKREIADEKIGNKELEERLAGQLAERLTEKESAAGRITGEEESGEMIAKDEITEESMMEEEFAAEKLAQEYEMDKDQASVRSKPAAVDPFQIAVKNGDALSDQITAESEIAQTNQTTEKNQITAVALRSGTGEVSSNVLSSEEKIMKFQEIMNHIIGKALEANSEKLSLEISRKINENIAEELEYQLQICDEREEARYRHLDEVIRSCQRENQAMAEAAAAKMPFFRRKHFGQKGSLT